MPSCFFEAFKTLFGDTKQCVAQAFFRVSEAPASASVDDILTVAGILILASAVLTFGLFKVVAR